MAFLDILKGRKKEEVKPKRLPKGAFSPKANRPLAEKQPAKPAKKQMVIKTTKPDTKKKKEETGKEDTAKETKKEPSYPKTTESKIKQSALAAEFLLNPHITEKSATLAEQGVYTFKIALSANKIIIAKAFREMYGFKPIRIRIINALPKKRKVRGKTGMKPGFKKALIYLKKGDKIEFI